MTPDPTPDPAEDALAGRSDELTRSLLHDWDLVPRAQTEQDDNPAVLRVRRRGVPGAAGAAVLRRVDPAIDGPSSTEHIVLRRWAGAGAVRLLSADPARGAVLVEDPLPGVDLGLVDLIEGCEALGAVLRRLSVPAPAQLQSVTAVLRALPERLQATPDVLPRRLVEEATALARSLADDRDAARVVPTALDFRSVVTATREPFLTTSGLALSGDPAYAVAAAVWDRTAEAAQAYRLRAHLRLRIEVICDVAGIDPARARAFTVVRTVARIAAAARRGDVPVDEVTAAISVVKAVQG